MMQNVHFRLTSVAQERCCLSSLYNNNVERTRLVVLPFTTFHFTDFLIHRGPIHRERRNYLRTALREMSLILSDQPGLLGPKVGLSLLSNKTRAFLEPAYVALIET